MLRDMYAMDLNTESLIKEMSVFVPKIKEFVDVYMKGAKKKNKGWNGYIKKIEDIEENFWSPRFGLKGEEIK